MYFEFTVGSIVFLIFQIANLMFVLFVRAKLHKRLKLIKIFKAMEENRMEDLPPKLQKLIMLKKL